MIISVTKKDIENGRRKECSFCPIALAVKPAFNAVVTVFNTKIHVDGAIYSLPAEVSRFIRDFDAGREVQPMRFEI